MPEALLPPLTAATEAFARLTGRADPTAAVPSCPGWVVRDLVVHIGGVHRWAQHAVLHGNPEGPLPPEPARGDPSTLAGWYAEQAEALLATLRETDPQAPAWTFGPHPRTAGWWIRRQLHETLVHTWDLAAATGVTGEWTLDPLLAWDGVDEVAHTLHPRQLRLGRTPPVPGSLVLRATDLEVSPIVLGDAEPTVELDATAAELYLVLWGRHTPASPAVAALLAGAITP